MLPVKTVDEVLGAIQNVKSGAHAFCTNFFPVQRKLESWIEHGELMGEFRQGAAFFLRRDRDFWHLYFSASSIEALMREISQFSLMRDERVIVDLVGSEAALNGLLGVLESAGFRRYTRLQRMARAGQAALPETAAKELPVACAEAADCQAVFELLDRSFDPYSDQLPPFREIESAIASRQVLALKCEGVMAALLFFETQGFTSTMRYWAVAEPFRSRRLGAALIRYYLAFQNAVKRFLLWVAATNENAVCKYQHYGYASDGLIAHVLANQRICP